MSFQHCQWCLTHQSVTAASSAEAEFLAAALTAKQAKCLRSILKELGFEQPGPTTLYCDNQSAINMVNARVPAERSRHVDVQHFAIQDWKEAGDITLSFIPGIINPSDDLAKPLGWILLFWPRRRYHGNLQCMVHNVLKYLAQSFMLISNLHHDVKVQH